jgi:hypothetical protein
MRDNIMTRAIRLAYDKGYRVTPEGSVLSPRGVTRKLKRATAGRRETRAEYLGFNVKDDRNKCIPIPVHMLAAYQLFGESTFGDDIQVRHLDCNSLNNRLDNLALGTREDNERDTAKHRARKNKL